MRTFHISTLGCKVNQYETEQIATLLRGRGLVQVNDARDADLRLVNTCSVTIQAASKSRQTVRQVTRLPVLNSSAADDGEILQNHQRVIVTGCWATSDTAEAAGLPGVSAVLSHQDDVARELERLLALWQSEDQKPPTKPTETHQTACGPRPESLHDGWMMRVGTPAQLAGDSKSHMEAGVKINLAGKGSAEGSGFRVQGSGEGRTSLNPEPRTLNPAGVWSLPVLAGRQNGHQRAFLKIQDGCDAHCTYCIIPKLRPTLRSKAIEQVVEEAKSLVLAGHVELVLTGIFLGAYGQATALRRRQAAKVEARVGAASAADDLPESAPRLEPPLRSPLQALVEALCTRVPGLRRLRFSSLEPRDLSDELIEVLRAHPQVVPHFHLPLQSGSDVLLRRMNRQYGRDDYLRMVDRVRQAFDRPALTTDIIVGFPGETDAEFARTLEVVDECRFIHIHAFAFSPRPGTAAARWQRDFVRGPVVNQRMEMLRQRAADFSYEYRRQFIGQTVELLVEKPSVAEMDAGQFGLQHGRCERYFSVFFDAPRPMTGQCVKVKIERVTHRRTIGALVGETK